MLGCVLQRGEVLLFVKEKAVLGVECGVVVGDLVIVLFGLDLASIAFLPEGEVKIAAVVANPVSFSGLGSGPALLFVTLVILFERGVKLVHLAFLLFGLK